MVIENKEKIVHVTNETIINRFEEKKKPEKQEKSEKLEKIENEEKKESKKKKL